MTEVVAAVYAVMAARTRGSRREHSRPLQWKRLPERAGGVRAATAGEDVGRRCGRRVALAALAVEEAAWATRAALLSRRRELGRGTSAAPWLNSVGPSQPRSREDRGVAAADEANTARRKLAWIFVGDALANTPSRECTPFSPVSPAKSHTSHYRC